MVDHVDVVVIGAGAAGLMCAAKAGERGLRVVVLEKQSRPGLKILISGGGRCNFTNLSVSDKQYQSQNRHFCKSALARFTPADFLSMMDEHHIDYHEKHRGQLFCDGSSKAILAMLVDECHRSGVEIRTEVDVKTINHRDAAFYLQTSTGSLSASKLVVATGGLSYAKLGATDFGYCIAKQFGHSIVTPRPALTPVIWNAADRKRWGDLAGVSTPAIVSANGHHDQDDLLFTHEGLSGPVILRMTLWWDPSSSLTINFLPTKNVEELLLKAKERGSKMLPKNWLAAYLPPRLATRLSEIAGIDRPIDQISRNDLVQWSRLIHAHVIHPARADGYEKAEVTAGGVNVDEVSSQTMESKKIPGLYFVGEVLDVTGELGGYNFQWAWASAVAAANGIAVG